MSAEMEIKVPCADFAPVRHRLEDLGATLRSSVSEHNILLDTPDHTLRSDGCLLRLRQDDNGVLLTYKGPKDPDASVKSRTELEVPVAVEVIEHP